MGASPGLTLVFGLLLTLSGCAFQMPTAEPEADPEPVTTNQPAEPETAPPPAEPEPVSQPTPRNPEIVADGTALFFGELATRKTLVLRNRGNGSGGRGDG